MIAGHRDSAEIKKRLGIAALLTVFFIVGYFGVGLVTAPQRARSLSTAIDRHIPFIAETVWFYLWSYSAALIPLFFVNCCRLFRMTAVAYCFAIAISLVCFLAVPVTAVQLRVNAANLNHSNFSDWAILVVYSLDTPYNLFPSLHVSLTTLAAISAWKTNQFYGAIFFPGLVLVVISVCTVKQHFALDAIAGLILAALLGWLVLPTANRTSTTPNVVWPGPIGYVALLVVAYSALYLAFRTRQETGFPALLRRHAMLEPRGVPPEHQWLGNPTPTSRAVLCQATPPSQP